jgi:glycosyltransferase involved in cell wall biosynthesis
MSIESPPRPAASLLGHRIGLLSTYPPEQCGLATFAAALEGALVAAGDEVTVVVVDDGRSRPLPIASKYLRLEHGDPVSMWDTVSALSSHDVAIVQHEYGIYGGDDGDDVLTVLRGLDVPSIVVLHTVPALPTPHQREVLEAVCASATAAVVMTDAARDRLLAGYRVDADRVSTIPHGAARPAHVAPAGTTHHLDLLTWGLLGPGKGIEHAIGAMSMLADVRPRLRYTVAGATHPKVFERDGGEYRCSLIRAAATSVMADSIRFDDTYRTVDQLSRIVASAALVVLPYDSTDQVTSGVLVDAIAAGRPVIATDFPHARELLATGAGIVVPHRDPAALAAAIRAAVCEPGRLAAMTHEAARLAPSLSWDAVAAQYRQLCDELVPLWSARRA